MSLPPDPNLHHPHKHVDVDHVDFTDQFSASTGNPDAGNSWYTGVPNGWTQVPEAWVPTPNGLVHVGGPTPEIVGNGYVAMNNGNGDNWLDSQSSPGGIDITTSGDWLKPKQHGDLDIVVARENVKGLLTDPNSSLDVIFNHVLVGTIKASDFVFANDFKTFEFDITGQVGAETLELRASAPTSGFPGGYVGLAIDSVTVTDENHGHHVDHAPVHHYDLC